VPVQCPPARSASPARGGHGCGGAAGPAGSGGVGDGKRPGAGGAGGRSLRGFVAMQRIIVDHVAAVVRPAQRLAIEQKRRPRRIGSQPFALFRARLDIEDNTNLWPKRISEALQNGRPCPRGGAVVEFVLVQSRHVTGRFR
jgi:hypothetical protein